MSKITTEIIKALPKWVFIVSFCVFITFMVISFFSGRQFRIADHVYGFFKEDEKVDPPKLNRRTIDKMKEIFKTGLSANDPWKRCSTYSTYTDIQRYQNDLEGCSFKGSLWSKDYRTEINWCMQPGGEGVSQDKIINILEERDTLLNECYRKKEESTREKE